MHQTLFYQEVRGTEVTKHRRSIVTVNLLFRKALQQVVKMSIAHNTFWSIANFLPYKLAQSVGQ
ncbi:hypothetical protein BK658_14060 [Pseudomonas brassicacearum]|uniref:Uncharacterized protein n=1 Tax=Pseudomonas brassicacearum TaxID=930166 RepID=A0A423GR12_9PSED|nr:hypothetical protein BK658_14060 [Pseudomonas brassicacearum]